MKKITEGKTAAQLRRPYSELRPKIEEAKRLVATNPRMPQREVAKRVGVNVITLNRFQVFPRSIVPPIVIKLDKNKAPTAIEEDLLYLKVMSKKTLDSYMNDLKDQIIEIQAELLKRKDI